MRGETKEEPGSPKFSEDADKVVIREDYFDTGKRLFYQMSSKGGQSSQNSDKSNKSTSIQAGTTPPMHALLEEIKMRSSLEGRSKSGSYDSPFFEPGSSQRPLKPRVDPFKKFENLPS